MHLQNGKIPKKLQKKSSKISSYTIKNTKTIPSKTKTISSLLSTPDQDQGLSLKIPTIKTTLKSSKAKIYPNKKHKNHLQPKTKLLISKKSIE